MRISVIIQARTSSTRLPSKVLMELAGHPMLWHVIERCRAIRLADVIIVATSATSADDPIEDLCRNMDIPCFRGDLQDVLSRYHHCSTAYFSDIVVRITSDCPLIDPLIVDNCIALQQQTGAEYVSNCLDRIFPRGLDCEVFTTQALEEAFLRADLADDREHVTPYIIRHAAILPYKVPRAYRGAYRLTVDEERDLRLMRHLYEKFYIKENLIDVRKVIQYLQHHPEIAAMNRDVHQKISIN